MGEVPGGAAMAKGDNTVYIGQKEAMTYIMAAMAHFAGGEEEVIIKARGRNISLAVDVAEMLRSRYLPDVKVKNVQIATEKVQRDDGKTSKVSSIEIFLTK